MQTNVQRPALFSEKYTLGNKLGSGTYSTVREGIHKEQNITYAIKIIPKVSLSREDKYALKSEVEILHSINHPNIIKLYAVYREPRFYYLVTEYMHGGELFERIVKKTKYSEKETIRICRVLLDAIGYCHERNIVHRDIKPENLLLCHKNDDIKVKISDFGFAKRVTSDTCLTTRCGSPNYVAPEIISRVPYGTPVDMWSIGVVIYILLCGYLPFADKSHIVLYRKIKQVRYQFHPKHWSKISKDAKDFITMLLVREPSQRFTARHALSHWWLRPRLEEHAHLKNTASLLQEKNEGINEITPKDKPNETIKPQNPAQDSNSDITDETSQISSYSSEDNKFIHDDDKTTKISNKKHDSLIMQQDWGGSHIMSSCSKLNAQQRFHSVNVSRRSLQ